MKITVPIQDPLNLSGYSLLEEAFILAVVQRHSERVARTLEKLPTYEILEVVAKPTLYMAFGTILKHGDREMLNHLLRRIWVGEQPLFGRMNEDPRKAALKILFGTGLTTLGRSIRIQQWQRAELLIMQLVYLEDISPEQQQAFDRFLRKLVDAVGETEASLVRRYPQVQCDPKSSQPDHATVMEIMGRNTYSIGLVSRVIDFLDTYDRKSTAEVLFTQALTSCGWPTWRTLGLFAIRRPQLVRNLYDGIKDQESFPQDAREHLRCFVRLADEN